MPLILTVIAVIIVVIYISLQVLIHITQDAREPRLVETRLPFLDPLIAFAKQRAGYLVGLR